MDSAADVSGSASVPGEPGYDATPRPRRHRRVQTQAAPGSDPTPQQTERMLTHEAALAAEDTDLAWGDLPPGAPGAGAGSGARAGAGPGSGSRSGKDPGDSGNDAQLLRDVPPHWG